ELHHRRRSQEQGLICAPLGLRASRSNRCCAFDGTGMFDLGISKMALIGAVALIVIGPEKLPRVARTVGTLLGKAQRYVNDVKSEVNRSMELDELRKMKENVESAARDVENTIRTNSAD